MYWSWASKNVTVEGMVEENDPQSFPLSMEFTACLDASQPLSNEDVWAIFARWQGLKTLQDMYRHPYYSRGILLVGLCTI